MIKLDCGNGAALIPRGFRQCYKNYQIMFSWEAYVLDLILETTEIDAAILFRAIEHISVAMKLQAERLKNTGNPSEQLKIGMTSSEIATFV